MKALCFVVWVVAVLYGASSLLLHAYTTGGSNELLIVLFGVVCVASGGYVVGRVHQAIQENEENRKLKHRMHELDSALLWCAGASDFQEDGPARGGWEVVCAPLIRQRNQEGPWQ